VIIFLHHFSHPICIVISLFLLINEVRMITFTHQLLARKNNNSKSLIMLVRTFQPHWYYTGWP